MKVEISVPESLSEITLEQYQRFMALDPNSDNDFLERKMLDIFCGVTDVLKVSKKDVTRISSKILETLKQPTPLIKFFTLDGKEFGFHPDLENISFGEYIDLDNLISFKTLDKAMSVLFRPILNKRGKMYQIEEYETSNKYDLRKMPLSVALGAMVFFWTLSSELSLASLKSLQSSQKDLKSTAQDRNTKQSTVGLVQFTHLAEETLQSTTKLQGFQLANAFIRYHILQKETESKRKS